MKKNKTEKNFDVMFLMLEVGMTDDELKECMHDMAPVVFQTRRGFIVSIKGYDHDRRELWEIPEVVDFYQRLVALGFTALLEVSTTVEGMARFPEMSQAGFGALEIWLCATGKMKKGGVTLTQPTMDRFFQSLHEANKRSHEILNQPKPHMGLKKNYLEPNTVAEEGQHRFQGVNTWRPIRSGKHPFGDS